MDNKYKVVYKGTLKEGVNSEQFVKEFMQRLKVPEHFARKLITLGRATTLKGNLDALSAEKFRQVMDGLGMQVCVEVEGDEHSFARANGAEKFTDEKQQVTNPVSELVCSQCGSRHSIHGTCLSCGVDNEIVRALSNKRDKRKRLVLSTARKLRVIFPPFDKVTVFVIAVTLYTAFVCIEGLISPFELIAMFVKDLLVLFVYGPVILLLVISPLMLPFTKLDLRWTCWPVIAIFMFILTSYTVFNYLNEPPSLENRVLLIYTVLWLAYMIFVVRFVEEPGFIIANEQVDVLTPIVAAMVSVAFVIVANKNYSLPWHVALLFGVRLASSIVPLVLKAIGMQQLYAHKQESNE